MLHQLTTNSLSVTLRPSPVAAVPGPGRLAGALRDRGPLQPGAHTTTSRLARRPAAAHLTAFRAAGPPASFRDGGRGERPAAAAGEGPR